MLDYRRCWPVSRPDFRHVNLSIIKQLPVSEGVNVKFRVEGYDTFDTPNVYIGNGNSAALFGKLRLRRRQPDRPNYTPRLYQSTLEAQF